jgi:hypothetical protein
MSFSILRALLDLMLTLVLWDRLSLCDTTLEVLIALRDMSNLEQVGFVACLVVIGHTIVTSARGMIAMLRSRQLTNLAEDEEG